uniref:Uncharacterized protein n=1 Tax=viral metagenome TaxID=1070528 RepID=A0A6C0HUR7_9ZZZZ
MIQYSNINDAWGNKEIFKKNILNNNSDIGKPVARISPKEAESIQDVLLAPVINNNNIPKVEQNIVVPITAPINVPFTAPINAPFNVPFNVPLSNTPIKNEKQDNNIINNNINNPVPIISDVPILSNQPIINNINNKEHFNSCSYAEHLNNCEACRNAIIEKFSSKSSACVNLFGMGFNISKDALQVIFIILIVAIFILLLSLVNIPMKDNLNVEFEKAFKLKYLMMNQMNYPNIY